MANHEKRASSQLDNHHNNHHNSLSNGPSPLLPTNSSHDHKSPSDHINSEGESGRRGFHPIEFFKILWRSSCTASKWVNILWPFVPAAIILHFVPGENLHIWRFAIAYVAVVPTANLLGFAGQEFARKLPKVAGILLETTIGSAIEVILFTILIVKHKGHATPNASASEEEGAAEEGGDLIPIIQAAILGSILTNLLLCLGLCFFVGGLREKTQKFHSIISEVGSGLLLVAAFGLLIPSAYYSALLSAATSSTSGEGTENADQFTAVTLEDRVVKISQATSIALIVAFILYVIYQVTSHHHVLHEVIEKDEHRDADRHRDLTKKKFTLTEALFAIVLSLALVSLLLVFLVVEIEHVVESGVPDQFLGLILLPLVEKAAEHLTAIDEAWDGVINVALFHCLGPSIQTALFNAPLVVLIGWGLDKPMDLNFEIFMIALLVLSILVVGNFLRDGESNWLEGALLVIVYIIIAIACWYYPNPNVATSNSLDKADVSMSLHEIRQLREMMGAHLGK